jgi:hypothetical protein
MQQSVACLLLVGLLGGANAGAGTEDAKATPVQKVIELLEGMLAKGKEQKEAEQIQFSTYKTFCEDTSAAKTTMINEANQDIDLLKADIEKYTADAAELGAEVAALDEDITVWTGDLKAAEKVRAIEKADFDGLHKDYSESVDALTMAIAVLKKQAYDRPQAASFTQLSNLNKMELIPPAAKKAIDAFLQENQEPDEGLAVSAPEAHGYDFRSKAIIDTLEKLLDEFIAERTAMEKAEMDSVHAYDMLRQDLEHQVADATAERDEKAELKAKKLQAKADAEGDLTDTTTTRDADQKYLDDLVATCETKATDFESRQTLRNQETEAITKAIAIISSGSVTGAAEKHLPTLLQISEARGSSLASLRAVSQNENQKRVAEFLKQKAHQLGSRVLAALAVRVGADAFGKVKKMIKDLIMRLMEEAAEETEHKGWCDTELSTNEQTRKEKTSAVETLTAEIDQLGASIATLAEDIADLTKAVADLDAAMVEATKIRTAESAKNAETVSDSQEAQTAVAQALTVLREFYAKAAESTALVQQPAPAIFDSPYKGMGAEGGGVISMLEVIESDFGRLEADTKTAEATAAEEYRVFMEDSKIDKTGKTGDITHKTAKMKDQEKTLQIKKMDLEGTQKEMTAAIAYYEKLKPDCIDAGVTYDDRVSRRKEEIESLQEALKILAGEDI